MFQNNIESNKPNHAEDEIWDFLLNSTKHFDSADINGLSQNGAENNVCNTTKKKKHMGASD